MAKSNDTLSILVFTAAKTRYVTQFKKNTKNQFAWLLFHEENFKQSFQTKIDISSIQSKNKFVF
jgi:hypothetical protein